MSKDALKKVGGQLTERAVGGGVGSGGSQPEGKEPGGPGTGGCPVSRPRYSVPSAGLTLWRQHFLPDLPALATGLLSSSPPASVREGVDTKEKVWEAREHCRPSLCVTFVVVTSSLCYSVSKHTRGPAVCSCPDEDDMGWPLSSSQSSNFVWNAFLSFHGIQYKNLFLQ